MELNVDWYRYTDFLVNEILPSGEVVHMTEPKFTAKAFGLPDAEAIRKKNVEKEHAERLEEADKRKAKYDEEVASLAISNEDAQRDADTHYRFRVIEALMREPHTEQTELSDAASDANAEGKHDGEAPDAHYHQPTASINAHAEQTGLSATAHDADAGISHNGEAPYPTEVSFLAVPSKPKTTLITFQISPQDKETLGTHFNSEIVNAILALYGKVIKIPDLSTREYGTVCTAAIDRENRGKAHADIRSIFHSKLKSQTDKDGRLVISAMAKQSSFFSKKPSTKKTRRSTNTKQATKMQRTAGLNKPSGEYTHFTLYKENKDTMEVLAYLCRLLKISPKDISYAGTKDRRAVTVQRISVYRVNIQRLKGAGKTLRGACIGDFKYHPRPLHLGELLGNEFVITLRDCQFQHPSDADNITIKEGAENVVRASTESFTEKGFINYYGLQRFGTHAVSTHEIGMALLQGNYEGAVEKILDYEPACIRIHRAEDDFTDAISQDDTARAQGIKTFRQTNNADLAIPMIPKKFSAEINIIRHIAKWGMENDFIGAILSITRNHRLLYLHSYQSIVWNIVASERWKTFGSSVVEGDLVLIREQGNEEPVNNQATDADGEIIVRPAEDDQSTSLDDQHERARPLTAEEANSGKYSISDVVLPLPGYDVVYPQNTIRDAYSDFMKGEVGGYLDPHDMRRRVKDFSLSGSYRNLIARPSGVNFELHEYGNAGQQLVKTEELHRSVQNSPVLSGSGSTGGVPIGGEKEEKEEEKLAVVIRMQLGAGQYATVALRELMKEGGIQMHKPDYSGGH